MDSKDVLWLTSVSAWLWLVPGIASAEPTQIVAEPESQNGSVTTSAANLLSSSPVEPLSAETSFVEPLPVETASVEAVTLEKLSEQAASLDQSTLTTPDIGAAESSITSAEPSHQQNDQAHPVTSSSVRSDVSQSSSLDSSSPNEESKSTAAGSSPRRLYGESEPEAQPIADLQDPLEQLSTEEWLHLLSDQSDEIAETAPQPSNQSALTATASPSISQPIPQPILVDRSQPELPSQSLQQAEPSQQAQQAQTKARQTSYAAADLGTVSTSQTTSQTTSQNRSLHQSTPNSLQESPFAAPLRELDQLASLFEPENKQSVNVATAYRTQAASNSSLSLDGPVFADSMAQVTSVSQLSDVQPTDWAYQALQSLVERYGVIEGYPDGLFRGGRALTRFEFAAGVNAAMDRLSQLIANSTDDAVRQQDLDALKRLQEDFSNELVALRGRVDGLEARVAQLESQQFSTTVVLNGQVTFGLADAWGGDPPGLGETNPVFAYLAQLQLSGSFSKRDAFRIDLDAGNFAGAGFAEPQALNTQMALMGFQTDTDNTLEINGAEYRFAVGDRLVFTLKPVGFSLNTVLSSNSIFSSSSQGALSRFAAETPIFKIGSLDSGVGLDWLVTDQARLQIAYGARDASDPVQGLFNSDHRAFGVQLLTRPFENVTTGIAYVNAFAEDGFLDTFTGSTNADTSGGFLEPAAIHAVSGTLQWQIVRSVILGAWGGLTVTDSLSSDAVALSTTYLFSLGFPDTFGREGDLLGIMVGQPFRLRYGLLIEREDEASGLHYEIFYRIRVNDNIAIIPGVFVVTDPGHVPDNNTIVVGAIRTAFTF